VVKLLFPDGSSSDFTARFADGRETHDVLQCPSANRAERACMRLWMTLEPL